jgi:phosphoribosylpyrophosphate synthetase
MNFFDKLSQAIAQNQSLLFVGLDPNPEMMPARYASSDIISSLWDWLQFIIAETAEQVCVYKPTLGFYGETVAVVDDILISGKSVMEGAEKLKSAGLNVNDIVVLIDHEHGVKDRLRENGYQGHAVLTISEITQTLYQAGRINDEQFSALKDV